MASHVVRVGDVEIMMLSDGALEFDPCNFFPTIPEENWGQYESHLHDHKVRFNLGSYLIRADMDPDLTRQTRKALIERLEREQILIAAGHFEAPGYGRIVRLDGRRYWKGL